MTSLKADKYPSRSHRVLPTICINLNGLCIRVSVSCIKLTHTFVYQVASGIVVGATTKHSNGDDCGAGQHRLSPFSLQSPHLLLCPSKRDRRARETRPRVRNAIKHFLVYMLIFFASEGESEARPSIRSFCSHRPSPYI